jgi:hypothetical protein
MKDNSTPEEIAKLYELINSENPPDLQSYLLVLTPYSERKDYLLPVKPNIKEVSDCFLWEDLISKNKLSIAENILITAEKANAVIVKDSNEGSLFQFKGSDEWITLGDYAETLLHQPFEDQLTHLFRFFLVEEFSYGPNHGVSLDSYEEILKDIYLDSEHEFPSHLFFQKAIMIESSLYVWRKKEWLLFDTSDNYLKEFSLKYLLDSGQLDLKIKDKIYLQGFVKSLTAAIYYSIRDFTNPFAEYALISLYLIPFKRIISLNQMCTNLENLGFKNKEFILNLESKELKKFYQDKGRLTLLSFLKDHSDKSYDELNYADLIEETGRLRNINNHQDEENIIQGLLVLLSLGDKHAKIKSNVIPIKDVSDNDTANTYEKFLPWWHAVNTLYLSGQVFSEYKDDLSDFIKNRLTDNLKFHVRSIDVLEIGFIQMKLLEEYDFFKLDNLPLDTSSEIKENNKKKIAWKEIDKVILNAYQFKISRSALSVKLEAIIKENEPLLDKAASRLKQLLDIYEDNIINN